MATNPSQVDDGTCFWCQSTQKVHNGACEACVDLPLYRTALDPSRAVLEMTHGPYWLLLHKSHDGIWFSWQLIDSKARRGIGGKRESAWSAFLAGVFMIRLLDSPISEEITTEALRWI